MIKKILALMLFLPLFLKAESVEELRNWLKEEIYKYELEKTNFRDSSDIYTYYMILAKQSAYEEVLLKLPKNGNTEVKRPKK